MGPTDKHRAIVSLMEELQAIDSYAQRAAACTDDALRAVFLHNEAEEVEHAMMLLEWLRRADTTFDSQARKYLFTTGGIVLNELALRATPTTPTPDCSLHVGSLRGTAWTS